MHSFRVLLKQQFKSCLFLGTIETLYPTTVHFLCVFQILQVLYDTILLITAYMSSWLTQRTIYFKYLASSKKCTMLQSNVFFHVYHKPRDDLLVSACHSISKLEKRDPNRIRQIFYLPFNVFKSSWIPQIICTTNKYKSQMFFYLCCTVTEESL